MIPHIIHLIAKDFKLELRQRYALNGILLYVVAAVFTVYLATIHFNTLSFEVKNSLFWIIMVFASVNAISKSFIQESDGRVLYYYCLVSSRAVILAKIVYNLLLINLLALICYLAFFFFLDFSVDRTDIFIYAILLASTGLSSVLTMVSAIASRTNNHFTLMAVLSFPLVLPLLLSVIKISAQTWDAGAEIEYINLFLMGLINIMVIILAAILFPYLWKD